jgi:hypothetical protein
MPAPLEMIGWAKGIARLSESTLSTAGKAQGALLSAGGRVPVILAGACLHDSSLCQAICPPGTHCVASG